MYCKRRKVVFTFNQFAMPFSFSLESNGEATIEVIAMHSFCFDSRNY